MVLSSDKCEQVHYCGMIESYGALIAINIKTLCITYISSNISNFLDTNFKQALGKPLEKVFPKALNAVNQLLSSTRDIPYLYKSLKYKKQRFYLKVCHANENIIIEIEQNYKDEEKKACKKSFLDLSLPLNEIEFKELCQKYVDTIKDIIGYDRVMLYKFDKESSGKVISQSKKSKLGSYLHKNFTTNHITPIIKRLYMLNSLRHIADVNADPYPIITNEKEALDLTYSDVRGASKRHINYLKSINAKASLSMPIIIDNELWALLAAHDIKSSYINSVKKQKAIKLTKSFENIIKIYNIKQEELNTSHYLKKDGNWIDER